MRGKLLKRVFPLHNARITPAGAGKTFIDFKTPLFKPDHPRRCGENYFTSTTAPLVIGSPPQVRGKHRITTRQVTIQRITPAGAGKTTNLHSKLLPDTDHPRRCGENKTSILLGIPYSGSPPQVRGKLLTSDDAFTIYGITPAGAGKTCVRCKFVISFRDHPRRCGENC